MERRKFIQNLGIGSLALPLNFFGTTADPEDISARTIVPKKLQPGDTIGIISPASAIFETEPYEIAKETFEAMGLIVKFGNFTKSRYGHLAGTDDERANELMDMFKDEEVKAIIALRGGAGSARLLEKLDYRVIKRNPKIFIGYSDITALHLAIHKKTGLVTFHGPVAVSTWNEFAYSHLKKLLFEGEAMLYENPSDKGDQLAQTKNRIRTITPGTAKGELLGGNLSVLTGIMGSEYFPKNWKGKILYLEDIGEKIYAVDRMMSQLQLGGVLSEIAGFVFGKCSDCDPGGSGYGSLTLEEVIDHYIKPLGIPAFFGAMIGHIDDNATIPNGIEAEIDAKKGTIKLLEPAVK
ncbi:muramoyltetrapeptide carboxypeptidase [Salinimicrobium catena]|uniref:Muramoyltetrapeptide carboxypeptidase n=1 Tax=Salinimicrobium catena TaxID=390640 RepID=A0A1H5NGC0_9FLAO|nr:LD-carboxypeptidase [Salinimicrobium catena]SDL45780.1 muramoyltetrapeptide carboxypeptidase [Salinimicrobium catena]SEF00605.1 muramoyltetrapeptide carboxypeptidase [Salinimicrobium catena]